MLHTINATICNVIFRQKKNIPENIAYKDIKYIDALKLSVIFQGGIVTWVAFWALYGQGFGIENLTSVFSLGQLI